MRILICEDSVLLREGLVRLLAEGGHETVAALPDAEGIDDAVAELSPDVCLLDVRLPPSYRDEGIQAAIRLRDAHPGLPVLVLSQYVEERYAAELISRGGPDAGAIGYLLKDRVADVGEFLDALERIASGRSVLDPEVVAQLLGRRVSDERMRRLTERETAVLALIAEGRSNQAIAAQLHVSEASVEKHITSIFRALDLEPDDTGNRRVLAALAYRDHGDRPRTGEDR